MKSTNLALIVLCLLSPIVKAEIVTLDTGEKSGKKISDITFGECHIRLADPFKGDTDQTYPKKATGFSYQGPLHQKGPKKNDLGIRFTCQISSPKIIAQRAGVALQGASWALARAEEQEATDEELLALKTTLVTFAGNNWSGAGVTQDQSSGDLDQRSRSFLFCIPHKAIAICGSVESAAQLANLKESAMPNIIKLLEGIEFVDDAAVTDGATTNTH